MGFLLVGSQVIQLLMVQRIWLYANDPSVDTQCYKTTGWKQVKPKLTATSSLFHQAICFLHINSSPIVSFLWNHKWLPTNCSPPTERLRWRGWWSLEIDTQKSGKAKNRITLSPVSMEVCKTGPWKMSLVSQNGHFPLPWLREKEKICGNLIDFWHIFYLQCNVQCFHCMKLNLMELVTPCELSPSEIGDLWRGGAKANSIGRLRTCATAR